MEKEKQTQKSCLTFKQQILTQINNMNEIANEPDMDIYIRFLAVDKTIKLMEFYLSVWGMETTSKQEPKPISERVMNVYNDLGHLGTHKLNVEEVLVLNALLSEVLHHWLTNYSGEGLGLKYRPFISGFEIPKET